MSIKKYIKKSFQSARGLFLDLIVVFIGVFAAFQLNDIREQKRAANARSNFFRSFQSEISIAKSNIDKLKERMDSTLVF